MQSSIARLCLALGLGTALVGCTVEPLEPDSDAEFRSGNCQDAIDDGFDDGTFPSRWERNGDVVPSGFGGPICNMMLANGSGQQWCDNNVNGDLGLAPGTAEFFVFSQNGVPRCGCTCGAAAPPPRPCCSVPPHHVGCDDSSIESCVCAVDSFCCTDEWDAQCVDEVESLGCGTCP